MRFLLTRGFLPRPLRRPPALRAPLRPGPGTDARRHLSSALPPPAFPPQPSRSLAGRVAVVTGAGARGGLLGNGRATALLLAEDGAAVVCADRDGDAAARTAGYIRSASAEKTGTGPQAVAVAVAVEGDVTRAADCEAIVGAALGAFGRVDILVNTVGIIGAKGTAVEVDMEEWVKGMEINVSSMVLMAKYAIPAMLRNMRGEDGIRGSIVNIGSVAGIRGGTPHLMYPTSKGAVVNMTRAMAAHHAGDGIRVNCVCPGESPIPGTAPAVP
jgi:NAD(P)-dependent dehydrogenase (short-subunit alcohol dehydrogenase family)